VFFDGQDMTKLVVTESDVLTRFLNAKREVVCASGSYFVGELLRCFKLYRTESAGDMIDRSDHHPILDATPV
jgi:hypothetical protein